MELWTAFIIGFLGSFHCVGMCGPIALALPGSGDSLGSQFIQKFLYNSGRIFTYTLFGAVFGLAGYSISLVGLQSPLSIFLGILIILAVIIPKKYSSLLQRLPGIRVLFRLLQNGIQSLMKQKSNGSFFTIGVLNGFLPCGFVYAGLAASLTTGSVLNGMLFMALFGLGTFPVMMIMAMTPGFVSLKTRSRINRFVPYFAILLGLILIARGIFISDPSSMQFH